MLQRKNRLTAARDFTRIFKKGKVVHAGPLSLRMVANQGEASRVAFVVSTKVSKRAVVRNQLKRRLREVVRLRTKDLVPGWDVVVMTKAQAADMPSDLLRRTMEELLKKARLLKV
jgi:ribonuclease P protein component